MNRIHHIHSGDESRKSSLELMQKFIEMRNAGTITDDEFNTLVRIITANYVEERVTTEFKDLFDKQIMNLLTASYV